MDDYITIQEASKKWNLSKRRIQFLCNGNKVNGAIKFGSVWAIPADAERPKDGRVKSGKYINSKKSDKET